MSNKPTQGRGAFDDVPPAVPHGRYLISISAARQHTPSGVRIHDTIRLQEECNTDAIKRGDRSRFDDLAWALQRGYIPCGHCMAPAVEETDEVSPEAALALGEPMAGPVDEEEE